MCGHNRANWVIDNFFRSKFSLDMFFHFSNCAVIVRMNNKNRLFADIRDLSQTLVHAIQHTFTSTEFLFRFYFSINHFKQRMDVQQSAQEGT